MPDSPTDRVKHGLSLGLGLTQRQGATVFQLQGHVLQDAHLQRGQQGLQVGTADVALGQPVEQRLRKLSCPTAAIEQSLQLLPYLS